METEFNMRATARRLTAAGYPISPAALGNCIRRDAGPPILRITPHGRRPPEQFIDWQDAMNWAVNREQPFYNRPRRSTRHEVTNQMEIHDQIILYCKEQYPDHWKRIRNKLPGNERLTRLNDIAGNALAVAVAAFLSVARLAGDDEETTL